MSGIPYGAQPQQQPVCDVPLPPKDDLSRVFSGLSVAESEEGSLIGLQAMSNQFHAEAHLQVHKEDIKDRETVLRESPQVYDGDLSEVALLILDDLYGE